MWWWAGFAGPPKLPSHIVDIWEKALQEMAKDPVSIAQMSNVGRPFYLNSREMREHVQKEIDEVRELWIKK